MGHTDFAGMPCPIARSMAVVGERWSILVLREAYYGSTRFDEFERHLGIAPNILSARLKTLVEHGLLERAPSPGARHVYLLTEKGQDFFPVFVALKGWADRWMGDPQGPLTLLEDRETGGQIAPPRLTRDDGTAITPAALRVRPGPGAGRYLQRRFGEADLTETEVQHG
jgi:DNA-binding HxlR family transcriptional regulator